MYQQLWDNCDASETKRVPAWTDRILWRGRSSQVYGGGGGGGRRRPSPGAAGAPPSARLPTAEVGSTGARALVLVRSISLQNYQLNLSAQS